MEKGDILKCRHCKATGIIVNIKRGTVYTEWKAPRTPMAVMASPYPGPTPDFCPRCMKEETG